MTVKSVLNENVLKTVRSLLIGKKRRMILLILIALCLMNIIWGIASKNYTNAIIFAFLFAVIVLEVILLQRRSIKITLARLNETYGSSEFEAQINFGDEMIVTNTFSGGKVNMQYDCLTSLSEKKECAVLMTKTRQFWIFPLDQFETNEQKQQFYSLLKEKAPNIKIYEKR